MIDSSKLLNDLRKLLVQLEDDIRERSDAVPEVHSRLESEHREARAAERTSSTFAEWRDEQVTQAGVAWILGCVFVRFMEDNGLIPDAWIAGVADRLNHARDQHTHFFRQHPRDTDRDYLLHVFETVRKLPAVSELFDDKHNPIWQLQPSGDGAQLLLQFFQKIDADQGGLIHEFTDSDWNTRFLGDLYQDMSESARKKYALLQTPEFVEEFILDRTLDPAIDTFGLKEVRLIDPTCGSGHFLLGTFVRILRRWLDLEPGTNVRELVQRTLKSIYGVDLNPFAVAIARFRLLVAALQACGVKHIKDAPNFHFNLAVGDSLLHGPAPGELPQLRLGHEAIRHTYPAEDPDAIWGILSKKYHAVVGNPPYIVVRDAAISQSYRSMFSSCHGKYSLAAPFAERFLDLGYQKPDNPASGFIGMITTNSFMKREYGRPLVEKILPRWNITHVIDVAGAFIPGHGTPTVILFIRSGKPLADRLRAVLGIHGEPETPTDAAQGKVWQSIVTLLDQPGEQNGYVSVRDLPRERFSKHPWNLAGGGESELKTKLDSAAGTTLSSMVSSIGPASFAGLDDCFVAPTHCFHTSKYPRGTVKPFVAGDQVRDWVVFREDDAFAPYDEDGEPLQFDDGVPWGRRLWPYRTTLGSVIGFAKKTRKESGDLWWTWYRWIPERVSSTSKLAFPFVASHNHFAHVGNRLLLNRSLPVLIPKTKKAMITWGELLPFLNSSTVCFWMKQVSQQKQMTGGDGIRLEDRAKVPYEFSATQLKRLPIPPTFHKSEWLDRLRRLADQFRALADQADETTASSIATHILDTDAGPETLWLEAIEKRRIIQRRMVFVQEEIDFTVYALFGLCGPELLLSDMDDVGDTDLTCPPGSRPFEIHRGASNEGFEVPKKIPSEWSEKQVSLWEARVQGIRSNPDLQVIEDPHYKRRWVGRQGLFNHAAQEDEFQAACQSAMLDRMETLLATFAERSKLSILSAGTFADELRADQLFMRLGEAFSGRQDFDVAKLASTLVRQEGVPSLSIHRYKPSGLRKHAEWQKTWAQQRKEDAIDAEVGVDALDIGDTERLERLKSADQLKQQRVGPIPAPPKYVSGDFKLGTYWRLRGKLDVPKERFVLFPDCERDADSTPVLAWAGWNHLEQAQSIAAYYEEVRNEGWSDERRVPLLASVLELVPWLKQWHNEYDATYGMRLGDFFEDFVTTEARAMGKAVDDIRRWTP